MRNNNYTLKKPARLAGFLYLFLIITGVYNIIYLTSIIVVKGETSTVSSSVFILFPDYSDIVKQPVLLLVAIGEISITLWLLIKGVKDNISIAEIR